MTAGFILHMEGKKENGWFQHHFGRDCLWGMKFPTKHSTLSFLFVNPFQRKTDLFSQKFSECESYYFKCRVWKGVKGRHNVRGNTLSTLPYSFSLTHSNYPFPIYMYQCFVFSYSIIQKRWIQIYNKL